MGGRAAGGRALGGASAARGEWDTFLAVAFPDDLAAVPAAGKITVRLVERPTQEFELAWADVAQVRRGIGTDQAALT